jgi:hypothetical protein
MSTQAGTQVTLATALGFTSGGTSVSKADLVAKAAALSDSATFAGGITGRDVKSFIESLEGSSYDLSGLKTAFRTTYATADTASGKGTYTLGAAGTTAKAIDVDATFSSTVRTEDTATGGDKDADKAFTAFSELWADLSMEVLNVPDYRVELRQENAEGKIIIRPIKLNGEQVKTFLRLGGAKVSLVTPQGGSTGLYSYLLVPSREYKNIRLARDDGPRTIETWRSFISQYPLGKVTLLAYASQIGEIMTARSREDASMMRALISRKDMNRSIIESKFREYLASNPRVCKYAVPAVDASGEIGVKSKGRQMVSDNIPVVPMRPAKMGGKVFKVGASLVTHTEVTQVLAASGYNVISDPDLLHAATFRRDLSHALFIRPVGGADILDRSVRKLLETHEGRVMSLDKFLMDYGVDLAACSSIPGASYSSRDAGAKRKIMAQSRVGAREARDHNRDSASVFVAAAAADADAANAIAAADGTTTALPALSSVPDGAAGEDAASVAPSVAVAGDDAGSVVASVTAGDDAASVASVAAGADADHLEIYRSTLGSDFTSEDALAVVALGSDHVAPSRLSKSNWTMPQVMSAMKANGAKANMQTATQIRNSRDALYTKYMKKVEG